jgi:hypothetical protein
VSVRDVRAPVLAPEYSPEEDEAHASWLGGAMVRIASRALLRAAFLKNFETASRARFDEMWGRLAGVMAAEVGQDARTFKPRQIVRLEAMISELKAEKKWAAAVRAEALLADLSGSRAPTEVRASVSVVAAFADMRESMDDAEIATRLVRARERRALAAAAESAGLVVGPGAGGDGDGGER